VALDIDSRRWWLLLQFLLGGLGLLAWGAGALFLHEDFLSGLGLGFLVSGLLLRFGRRAVGEGRAGEGR
jgi:hypothetical protein